MLGGERAFATAICAGSLRFTKGSEPQESETRALRRMSAVVSSVIAALSAFAALASLFLYLYFGRRSDLAAAREEALVTCGDGWRCSKSGTAGRRRTVNAETASCSPRSTSHEDRRATRHIARSTSTPLLSPIF
jgi:hypothetical protein